MRWPVGPSPLKIRSCSIVRQDRGVVTAIIPELTLPTGCAAVIIVASLWRLSRLTPHLHTRMNACEAR